MRGLVLLVILFIQRLFRLRAACGALLLRLAEALKRLLRARGLCALCRALCGRGLLRAGALEAEARRINVVVIVLGVFARSAVRAALPCGLYGLGAALGLLGLARLFEAAADGRAVGVLIVVLVELVGLIRFLALAAEDYIDDEQQAEHRDEDIRHIEHGEVEQIHLEHIHHVAVQHAVKAVGKSARRHEHEAPAAEAAVDEIRDKCDYHGDREHSGEDDEIYPRPAARQKAEGGAIVMQPDKTENAGYQRLGYHVHHKVLRDPELHPLVKDYDQNTDYSIQHIFLLSAIA